MNDLKSIFRRPYISVLALLGVMVGTGMTVHEYDDRRENERIKATKTAQIEAGMASFLADVNPGPYVVLSDADKRETVMHALGAQPLNTQPWSERDLFGFCGHWPFLEGSAIENHQDDINPWLTQQINDVAKLMGSYDEQKPFAGIFVPCKGVNAFYDYEHKINQNNRLILVYSGNLDYISVASLKVIIGHEIGHDQQPEKMDYFWREPNADLISANTFGPQAVIDMLEDFRPYNQEEELDEHGLISGRENIVRQVFARQKKPAVGIQP